jgi:hypothetical protein
LAARHNADRQPAGISKSNIEIRNNFKETEMHTSLFALIRGQLEPLAEESA